MTLPSTRRRSTRDHIVDAADQLFYRQGYEHTSFADIAAAVQISRGNFYHHFKSKDDILDAVIDVRLTRTRDQLAEWEARSEHPQERIRSFIRILITNRPQIKRHGCPVGTLSTELAKLNHASRPDATGLFTLFRTWLREQFELLGRQADADELAMHVLARSQGVATLATAYRDDAFIHREVEQLEAWLQACVNSTGLHA